MDAAGYRLQAAHHNMRRLRDVFSSQLHAFEHGRTLDLLLMHDVLDCLNHYVAISDSAYRDGLGNALGGDGGDTPARLVPNADQEAIGGLGERCLALIEDMIGGVVVSRSMLLTPGRRYLQLFENHLRGERAFLQRHRGETSDDTPIDSLCPPRADDPPMGEFTKRCKRLLEVTAQLETDECGLSVCAACGIAATSSAGEPSLAFGN